MQNDDFALRLGEIAGTLKHVAAQQATLLAKQDAFDERQSTMLAKLTAVETTQAAHETRLAATESRVSRLQQASTRNSVITGMFAGTGVTLIAEGLRQWLRAKGGG